MMTMWNVPTWLAKKVVNLARSEAVDMLENGVMAQDVMDLLYLINTWETDIEEGEDNS